MSRFAMMAVLAAGCAAPQVRSEAQPARDERYFCRYTKNPASLPEGALSLTREGPPVARFVSKNARQVGLTMTVPPDGVAPVRTDFTTGWVTYRLWLTPSAPLRLYPLEAERVGEVLELGRGTALTSDGLDATGRKYLLRPQLPKEWLPTTAPTLALACEDTAMTSGVTKWPDEPDGGVVERRELVADADIPFSAAPGLPPEGVLHVPAPKPDNVLRAPGLTATVLEQRGDAVKVRVQLWPTRLTGWIDAKFTAPKSTSDVYGVGGLGMLGGRDGSGKPQWERCGTGVPLFLLRDGVLEPAGELRPKAAFEVGSQTASWTEVTLPENAWLTLEPGLAWALKPGDLERCRTPAQPK